MFLFLLFEVDEKKIPSQVTGTMDVEIPADTLEEELQQIKKALQETIAETIGLDPKEIEVIVNEAICYISFDDPTLDEEIPTVLKTNDFVPNVNTGIVEKFENVPERIREVLEIEDVNVNYFI